jgi:hypothetical protein
MCSGPSIEMSAAMGGVSSRGIVAAGWCSTRVLQPQKGVLHKVLQ